MVSKVERFSLKGHLDPTGPFVRFKDYQKATMEMAFRVAELMEKYCPEEMTDEQSEWLSDYRGFLKIIEDTNRKSMAVLDSLMGG